MTTLPIDYSPEYYQKYEEMKDIVKRNVCAECERNLTIHLTEDGEHLEVWCPFCKANHGYIEWTTITQEARRGGMIVHPSIQANIERKMLINRPGSTALLRYRFPDIEWDERSIAVFALDCMRLSLDPFLGEIVPVARKRTIKATGEQVVVVVPTITEDGSLSLAARACPNDWIGPPKTMRLEEYLSSQSNYKERPYEEIKTIAADIKKDLCKDENAYVWVAIGARRDCEEAVTYGWFKASEVEATTKNGKPYTLKVPAAGLPGNQARVRAIKRWAREVFPEAKAKMQEMTSEWLERAAGVPELTTIIEAEYHLLETTPPSMPVGDEKFGTEDDKGNGEGPGVEPQVTNLETPKGDKPQKKSKVAPPRDPATITNFGELYAACEKDWGMTRQDVWKECGVSSQEALTDLPSEIYRQISTVRTP